jgi:Zn-dependent peptidase ImmA (M78 family)
MASLDSNRGAKRAREAREALGLAPDERIECVVELVEQRGGVPVFVLELPEEVSGAYKPDGPFMFVNRRQAVTRQRFTVAHEFGHHRLGHRDLKLIDTQADIAGAHATDAREVQANAFAAELLAPKAAVQRWWEASEHGPGLEGVCRLAHAFAISPLAALFRLSTAGLIERPELLARLRAEIEDDLHVELSQRLGLGAHDDVLQRAHDDQRIRLPQPLQGGALAALIAGEITTEEAARRAGRAPHELAQALEALRI